MHDYILCRSAQFCGSVRGPDQANPVPSSNPDGGADRSPVTARDHVRQRENDSKVPFLTFHDLYIHIWSCGTGQEASRSKVVERGAGEKS